MLIPVAYRSLSRLSSPLRAKASPVYPFLLSSTIPPFARYVCFFYSVVYVVASLPSVARTNTYNFQLITFNSQTTSYLLFSLSITSSNMSKNVLSVCSCPFAVCSIKLPTVNCLLLTGMVENNGFEPLTPCVQGRCSSQLS